MFQALQVQTCRSHCWIREDYCCFVPECSLPRNIWSVIPPKGQRKLKWEGPLVWSSKNCSYSWIKTGEHLHLLEYPIFFSFIDLWLGWECVSFNIKEHKDDGRGKFSWSLWHIYFTPPSPHRHKILVVKGGSSIKTLYQGDGQPLNR